tara:strand:- start:1557 stop:2372 length:816 start_codon:yes stop_codon:yes gene_type:complete
MKKLITLLLIIITSVGYSQNSYKDSIINLNNEWYELNKEKVELEFVRLIDSARQSNLPDVIFKDSYTMKSNFYLAIGFTGNKEIFDTKKQLKEKLKEERKNDSTINISVFKGDGYTSFSATKQRRPVNVVYDSLLTLAAEHHSKYQVEVEPAGFYSHQEYEDYFGFKYVGKLPVLEHPGDRIKYYCPNRSLVGECIGFDPTHRNGCMGDLYKKNIKDFAYSSFIRFKNSEKHWEIFMEEGDVPFMGVYMGMSKETNYIVFVTIMGKERDIE